MAGFALSTEAQVERFIRACRSIKDPIYRYASVVDILLLTRPPTHFDIARRWAKAKRSLNELSDVTNAVRGTRYSVTTVRQPNAQTIDVTTLDRFMTGRVQDAQLVLGNVRTDSAWWTAAAKGTPIVNRQRMAGIGRVVNEAIRLRHRRKQPTVLVLPELSLPRRLLRALAQRLIHEDVNLVAGLEYVQTRSGVVNEAIGVFAPGFKVAAVCWWPKTLPARIEQQELHKLGLTLREHKGSPVAVSTDFGYLSTLICSELLDVKLRASLLGRVDILVVPSWNQDTATFDHTIQTASNDLHCFAAVANNALFSDCRLHVPHEERHLRDMCRLVSRDDDTVIAVSVSAEALRAFQLASLANPNAKLSGFKPIPPGFVFDKP